MNHINRIAPLASMGAELLGEPGRVALLPRKYAKAERVKRMMELAGKAR
jgi:hypothetical protein